jgi:hypothetical protein
MEFIDEGVRKPYINGYGNKLVLSLTLCCQKQNGSMDIVAVKKLPTSIIKK